MRIFRTLMVLGAAGLFLPSPPVDPTAQAPGAEQPSTLALLSSAGSAAADAWSFCSRQPEVCEVAGYLASRLEAKAFYSASLLWGWAADRKPSRPVPAGPFTAITVEGDMDSPATVPGKAAGTSTLRLEDLVPPWRGPAIDG